MLDDTKLLVKTHLHLTLLRLRQPNCPRFVCPVCNYSGVFLPKPAETATRSHAECPECHALERHRLQWLVFQELRSELELEKLRVLHMAPEPFFEARLRPLCASYVTADINGKGVDRTEDLTHLSFPDASFDLVYASHVLEHIQNDVRAIGEIRRVLSPRGVAVLPVPIIAPSTVEYGGPNWYEHGHVRAPGVDYFDRYRRVFGRVKVFESSQFDQRFQVCIYEDRSRWPASMPNRPTTTGSVHPDYIPVCYAS